MHWDQQRMVMVLERDPQVRSRILSSLQEDGFGSLVVSDVGEAIYRAETHRPDLVLLDFDSLGPSDGVQFLCKEIRTIGLMMPMIFLVSRTPVESLYSGLKIAGPGSDFMRKHGELAPMERSDDSAMIRSQISCVDELMLRIRTLMPQPVTLIDDDLRLDRRTRVVERLVDSHWEEICLQPLHYEVLSYFVESNRAVVSAWGLFQGVFEGRDGTSDDPDDYRSRVWSCISGLRKRLDESNSERYIETIRGVGYRFRTQPDRN